MTGPIPASIGSLSQLQYLGLGTNGLSGEVPASLLGLNFLAYLGLAHNCLSPPSAALVALCARMGNRCAIEPQGGASC